MDPRIRTAIDALPASLRDIAHATCTSWSREVPMEWIAALPDEVARSLAGVVACSGFVADSLIRRPDLVVELAVDIKQPRRLDQLGDELRQATRQCADEAELVQRLRHLRRREWVRLAWRDLAGWADLAEVMTTLSAFADAAIDGALGQLHLWQSATTDLPRGTVGNRPLKMVVLGLGKLGGNELNFSSDIDLLFAFPTAGATSGPTVLGDQEFFLRLAQKLTNVLAKPTADGFVFRVDMRLRPFGESGPLVLDFDSLEEYYAVHGRDWERYALAKARAVAGDLAAGDSLLARLRPFVFRKYVDFSVIAAMREMKAQIVAQVRKRGLRENVKLGQGGIREIEFIGQLHQLLRGGKEPALRKQQILAILEYLGEQGDLSQATVTDLIEAYHFLRDTEHRLQMLDDQQTQDLPNNPADRDRIAHAMGYSDWAAFATKMATTRDLVHRHFNDCLRNGADPAAGAGRLSDVWLQPGADESSKQILVEAGFDNPAETLGLLGGLRSSRHYQDASDTARRRVAALMPSLLHACGRQPSGNAVLGALLRLVDAIVNRSAYLALLTENPTALTQLVQLVALGSWVNDQLVQYPMLLDELLDPRTLYAPPTADEIRTQVAQMIDPLDPEDLEVQMNALREIRRAGVFRVACADLISVADVDEVSGSLSAIADVLLATTLRLVWRQLTRRHGIPRDEQRPVNLVIVAYGKLGSREMGYGSDLDLVFLHDGFAPSATTDGADTVPNAVFFTRLAQRCIHVLTALTTAGRLYEVDLRLRPSGNSGPLTTSLAAFEKYQSESAWTWEHQALVRARPVVAIGDLATRFSDTRASILAKPRDPSVLWRDITAMRERLRREKPPTRQNAIKQGAGGLVDLEFIAQFEVLAQASHCPALCEASGTLDIFAQAGAAGLLTAREVSLLHSHYRTLLAADRRNALGLSDLTTPPADTATELALLWERLRPTGGDPAPIAPPPVGALP